jgi:hypothetical protein
MVTPKVAAKLELLFKKLTFSSRKQAGIKKEKE